MPVRKIPKNYRFLTGVFGGTKNVGKASFESPLERDLQILLEFDPDILEYEAQPVLIPRTDGKGRARFLLPMSGSSTVPMPFPHGGERP